MYLFDVIICTIGKFNMFALADLGASVNMMSYSLYRKLNLINLKEKTAMVEMADMSRTTLRGVVDNVLLRINKSYSLMTFWLST